MKNLRGLLLFCFLVTSATLFAQTAPASSSTKTEKKTAKTKKVATTTTTATVAPTKKDGTLDKRYKENKKLKKDGTPDKRFKENKAK